MQELCFKFCCGLKTAKVHSYGEWPLLFIKGFMLKLGKALYIKLLQSCYVGMRKLNMKQKNFFFIIQSSKSASEDWMAEGFFFTL